MNTKKNIMNRKVRGFTFILLFLSGILLVNCDEQDPQAIDSYLPLNDNFQWTYHRWLSTATETFDIVDTIQWTIRGDTAIEGKTYKKVIDSYGNIVKAIRNEGSKYYGRNHEFYGGFTHEYVFLDTDLAVGGSWSYYKYEGAIKTEYIVKATSSTHTFYDKVFENVLELEVNYYNRVSPDVYELNYSTKHFYAKGIGEIYSFYPYPFSGAFADLNTSLIDYKK